MHQILLNLALIELGKFVREQDIDTGSAGTYVKKRGRGYTYDLMTGDTGKYIASVTFHKASTPTFGLDISHVLERVDVAECRRAFDNK